MTQVPSTEWRILRHYATPLALPPPAKKDPSYVFYTIGNVADPRKNINMLLRVFMELTESGEMPNAKLLIKATCV